MNSNYLINTNDSSVELFVYVNSKQKEVLILFWQFDLLHSVV